MDPTRTVGATERTQGAGRDGRTDRRSETNLPPPQMRDGGINKWTERDLSWEYKELMSFYISYTNHAAC